MKGRLGKNSFLYYPTLLFGFIFTISPFLLIKVIATSIAVFILIVLNGYWWAPFLAILAFFLTLAILLPIGKYLTEKGLLLSEFSRNYKKSYLLEYGENYKEPKFEEFDLLPEDYYSFNRSFKIDINFVAFMIIPFVFGGGLLLTNKRGFLITVIFSIIAFIIYITTKYLCLYINFKITSKHYKYENIESYNKAKLIYEKIQEEIKAHKTAFNSWDD